MTIGRVTRDVAIGAAFVATITLTTVMWIAAADQVAVDGPVAALSAIVTGLTSNCYVLVGALIEIRRPGHRVGRLMIVAGPLYGLLTLIWAAASGVEVLLDPWGVAVATWAGVAASWAGIALIADWIPLLFPTGTLPGPRWRIPAALVGGLGTAGVVAGMFRPGPIMDGTPYMNPFAAPGWPPVLDPLVDLVPALLIALIVLAVTALAARFRGGSQVERLQVRWLLAGVGVVGLGLTGNLLEGLIRTDDGYYVTAVVFTLGILLIPVTIGIAILRYRLYDIDRVVSRTIAYAVLTALLAAAFIGTNLALQGILVGATGGTTLTTAIATLVVAALFQPARRRIQAPIDRRFNRRRVDGERIAQAFATGLRDHIELDAVLAAMVSAADEAVSPTTTGMWIRDTR